MASSEEEIDQDEVPTKRQSGTLFIVRDIAVDTAAKLEVWSSERMLADTMELRHSAMIASRLAVDCREAVKDLESWFDKPPSAEEKRQVIDHILALRDHGQQVVGRFGLKL